MLLKKILHLKKKIKKSYCNIQKINSLIENNKSLNFQIDSLKKQITEKNKELNLIYKRIDDVDDLKEKILDLQSYKDMCANDIPVMASAITELYNILNVIVTGRTVINKKFDEEDLILSEETSCDDYFENEDLFFDQNKKKKVYH